jgi:hypothetical protein
VLESDEVFEQIIAANGDLFVDLPSVTPLRHRKDYQQHRELQVPAETSARRTALGETPNCPPS